MALPAAIFKERQRVKERAHHRKILGGWCQACLATPSYPPFWRAARVRYAALDAVSRQRAQNYVSGEFRYLSTVPRRKLSLADALQVLAVFTARQRSGSQPLAAAAMAAVCAQRANASRLSALYFCKFTMWK